MDNNLGQRIRDLTDAEALEAAQLYALEIGALPENEIDGSVKADEIVRSPEHHIVELAQLARLLLLSGAANNEPAVRRSVEGAGQTEFILGGAEIVILAALLVTAYHIYVTKGKAEETTTTKTTTLPNGIVEVEVTNGIKYGISGKLAALLAKIPG